MSNTNREQAHVPLKERVKQWNHVVEEEHEKQKHNPYSPEFVAQTSTPHDEHYGHPPAGSLTEKRGLEAGKWVDKEVDFLVEQILAIGQFDEAEGGRATVSFGELFEHYTQISNTVVGICMRARKRGRIKYESHLGEMLFQGASDGVKITVL